MIITSSNLLRTKHEVLPFTGKWLDSFGTPASSGSWLIYGGSGSGKTSFALQLAKYLTSFSRVIYWSLEQGNTASFAKLWRQQTMDEINHRILIADDGETFDSLRKKLLQKRGYDVLIIDSLTPLRAQMFDIRKYEQVRKVFKNKLLIWLSHEKMGYPDTKVGDYILKLSDVKVRVEGYKAFAMSRTGERFRDYVIWERGAKEYWIADNKHVVQ
jgi:nicotinamide riboside kinase